MTDNTITQDMLRSTMRFLAKAVTRPKKVRLGDLLLKAGVISEEQLQQALVLQKRTGHKLGRTLTETGALSEPEFHKFLAMHLDIEFLDLSGVNLHRDTVLLLAEVQARKHRALVLRSDEERLLVGMADPTDLFAYDELCRLLKRPIRLALVKESDLLRTIDVMYRRTDEIDALAAEVKLELGEGGIDIDQLTVDADSAEAPVIKLIQSMFKDAVQVSASDIHIEPEEFMLRIRQRVDGMLQEHVIDGRGVSAFLAGTQSCCWRRSRRASIGRWCCGRTRNACWSAWPTPPIYSRMTSCVAC